MPRTSRYLCRVSFRRVVPNFLFFVVILLATGSPAFTYSDIVDGFIKRLNGDYPAAFSILHPFALQGNAAAEFQIGMMYLLGQGISLDVDNAFLWMERSARHGNEEAQVAIGRLYADGRIANADHCVALKWFSLAARRGSPEALTAIGELALAHAVAHHPSSAVAWFEKAARFGYAKALHHLGRLSLQDHPPWDPPSSFDAVRAYMWFVLAADFGGDEYHDVNESALLHLRETMMPGQVAEAERAASHWYEVNMLDFALAERHVRRLAMDLADSFPGCALDSMNVSSTQDIADDVPTGIPPSWRKARADPPRLQSNGR